MRHFVTSQGLCFVMFDTVEGEERSVHAVISLNGWDMSATFKGFDQETVDRVLDLACDKMSLIAALTAVDGAAAVKFISPVVASPVCRMRRKARASWRRAHFSS